MAASSLSQGVTGLRGRLHHLISVAKSFEIALTLLLSRTPFDLAARYDVAEGVARPHDVMAQPPKLSFSNGNISRTLCRRHVGPTSPTPFDSAPETLPTLKFQGSRLCTNTWAPFCFWPAHATTGRLSRDHSSTTPCTQTLAISQRIFSATHASSK